jgi:putative 4-mercaptohistidine N1-methyltranferase
MLGKWFDATLEPQDLQFVKAETARKFVCGTQQLTFWQRREQPRLGMAVPETIAPTRQPHAQARELGQGIYEDDAKVSEFLELHYGPNSEYPAACAAHCIEVMREVGQPMGKALEIGAGPGRSALELAKAFESVHCGDSSQKFVESSQSLLSDAGLKWKFQEDCTSGTVVERSVSAKDFGLSSEANISFAQMDAHKLPQDKFDLICGFDLLDRLETPQVFLQSIKDRLNQGGVLVLSSPYTLLEECTPKDSWLGGYKYGDNDSPTTYKAMKDLLLADGFHEIKEPKDVWFRINQLGNGRASEQVRSQMTFWRRM